MVAIFISIIICFVLGTLGEYSIHRWFMHRRSSSFYQSHHVEHHGLYYNQSNHMGLNTKQLVFTWLAISPISIILSYYLTPLFLPIITLFLIWWFYSWGYIHRDIHEEPNYWWGRYLLPWFSLSKTHHLNHHIKTTTNYGAIFFWSDWIFGTVYKGKKC